MTGLGAAGVFLHGLWPRGAVAGPFELGPEDSFPVPADKKLDAAWVESLFARGTPTVYRSKASELGMIGMPIGGICCGQVYLGGDGKLWHWDIFNLPQTNAWNNSSGPLYAKPATPQSPIEQGFALRCKQGDTQQVRILDQAGFREIEFRGQYPIGLVDYADAECPVKVGLEAFSPFRPLDADSSGRPAIVLNYTVSNPSDRDVDVEIAGWLQNPVGMKTGRADAGMRIAKLVRGESGGQPWTAVEFSARPFAAAEKPKDDARPEVVFEDWEKGTYEGWTVTGTAFGDRPRNLSDVAGYQGDLNAQGRWTVNSHQTRGGEDVVRADAHVGTLTSRAFSIDRNFISFRIGGGKHAAQTCVNLLVDGAPVRTSTGADNNRMRLDNWDVRDLRGREARIQIVDGWTGGWGQIGCDDIVFCDGPRSEPYDLERAPDIGEMMLSVLGPAARTAGRASVALNSPPDAYFRSAPAEPDLVEFPLGGPAAAGCVRSGTLRLEPGGSAVITFIIAWWFPNVDRGALSFLTDSASLRRWYVTRAANAGEVLSGVVADLDRLTVGTRLWRDTWYDSTLPHWFLDRTFANNTTAATATCWRFENGRFYGWEGTYCCAGTCTHVWQYAHGLARIFPELERSTREMVDFGLAFHDDTGQIDYRAEADRNLAVDGQCGTILRAYREHQMSRDDGFLRRVWPRVRKAVSLMLSRDTDADGVLDGPQYNTLDTTWYGQISWLTSLYLAAVRAGAAMAEEMGDAAFADGCRAVADRGSRAMVERLFNGEYFVHVTDPAHPEANSTGVGCHIDQLLGQSWAHQVGLPRIVPADQSRSALRSLYKYSFAPDVGPYRSHMERVIKGGRWYAMPGEGGLLMCTWPKGGAQAATGKSGDAWAAGYFNECMSGFEHQVASHMIWEGLVLEGLAITRMIHDRYHAKLRNPWNEVECSNHYARALAGYGSFLAACGFEHHGPRGFLAFSPRLTPEDFRAAFTVAGAWGQLRQRRDNDRQVNEIDVRYGGLRVRELGFDVPDAWTVGPAVLAIGDERIPCRSVQQGRRVALRTEREVEVHAGRTLRATMSRP